MNLQNNMQEIYETNFPEIPLLKKGKVREVYDFGDRLLIVATDRISAFDYVMQQPIPQKGVILTQIAKFWLNLTNHIIPNHFLTDNVVEYPEVCQKYSEILNGRSMLVKRTTPLPIEFVVRGYITGSAWKEYLRNGSICGINLPTGLQEFDKLDSPIFTPTTKNDVGHDENITFEQTVQIIGEKNANYLRKISLKIYEFAHNYLLPRGIILADTKFEFGSLDDGSLILIDELLTPDSSRFWLKDDYDNNRKPTNFDKQVLRDYLNNTKWDKNSPPPELPQDIIDKTRERYQQALSIIIGN